MKKLLLLLVVFSVSSHAGFIPSRNSAKYIHTISKIANCIVKNQNFLSEVKEIRSFDFSLANGLYVVQQLEKDIEIKITTYRPWNRWSVANAYSVNGKPLINFNVYNNPRPIPKMVNTVIHESLHVYGINHGDQYRAGKEKSANYWVGEIAEKYVKECL
jgi:hypothetical protein